jgi:anti-repressor protein
MNNIEIFNDTEFGTIRAAEIDRKPYAVGVEIARALGYAKPSQAVVDHCRGIRKLGIPHQQVNQHGYVGETIQETNMIPEGDIYRLIIKAAEQSRNPAIKEKAARFEKWIFEDVLPSIRKRGAYFTKEKAKESLNNPDLLISLLNTIKEKDEENERLQNRIEDDKPKVAFADALTASQCSISIGDFAKILQSSGIEIGPNHLFERLREAGLLIKRRGVDRNSPTQKAMKLELFSVNESMTLHPDGGVTLSRSTKITPKGQRYLINFFLNKGRRKKNGAESSANQMCFNFFILS